MDNANKMNWGLPLRTHSVTVLRWENPICLREGQVYAASTGWTICGNTLYWVADDRKPSVAERAVFAFACDLSQVEAIPIPLRSIEKPHLRCYVVKVHEDKS